MRYNYNMKTNGEMFWHGSIILNVDQELEKTRVHYGKMMDMTEDGPSDDWESQSFNYVVATLSAT